MKRSKHVLLIAICGLLSNWLVANTNPIVKKGSKETAIPKEVTIWLNKELAKSITALLENFESPAFFRKENAKIVGYIKNYDAKRAPKTVMFYYTNQFTRESKPRVLKIHEDGRFEMELPLEIPMHNSLNLLRSNIPSI